MLNAKEYTIDEIAEIAELPKDEVIRLSSEVK
jgi:anaerobic selenocysteine-containing dehydrogenase